MGNTKLKCEDYKPCNIKDKDGYCMNNERSCIWREGAVDTSDGQLTIPDVIKSVCDVGEVFISCCRFDDNSKIGCAYCGHFKQTVL